MVDSLFAFDQFADGRFNGWFASGVTTDEPDEPFGGFHVAGKKNIVDLGKNPFDLPHSLTFPVTCFADEQDV